jgi:hypothetical protein
MLSGFWSSRRTWAAGTAVLVVAGGVVWFATRGAGSPPPKVQAAGPPVVHSGVTFTPVRAGNSPSGRVDGYAIGLPSGGPVGRALASGKTVVIPGPNGGTIEMRQVEPTPPPPPGGKTP